MRTTLEAGHSRDRLGIVLVAYDNADSIGQLLAALSEEKRPGELLT